MVKAGHGRCQLFRYYHTIALAAETGLLIKDKAVANLNDLDHEKSNLCISNYLPRPLRFWLKT